MASFLALHELCQCSFGRSPRAFHFFAPCSLPNLCRCHRQEAIGMPKIKDITVHHCLSGWHMVTSSAATVPASLHETPLHKRGRRSTCPALFADASRHAKQPSNSIKKWNMEILMQMQITGTSQVPWEWTCNCARAAAIATFFWTSWNPSTIA